MAQGMMMLPMTMTVGCPLCVMSDVVVVPTHWLSRQPTKGSTFLWVALSYLMLSLLGDARFSTPDCKREALGFQNFCCVQQGVCWNSGGGDLPELWGDEEGAHHVAPLVALSQCCRYPVLCDLSVGQLVGQFVYLTICAVHSIPTPTACGERPYQLESGSME